MRRIYWCFAAIGSMAIMGTVAACSSDDSSTGGTDAGGTDGGGGDVVVPKDSGGTDAAKDSGPCSTCGELLAGQGSLSNACPGTLNKAFAVIACACNNSPAGGSGQGHCDVDSGTTSADGGAGACGSFCASPTTTLPDSTCQACGADQCPAELGACINDGKDAGTGDGGDGG